MEDGRCLGRRGGVVGRVELYEHMRAVAHDAQLACSGRPPSACVAKVKLSSVMDGIENASGERT